MIPAVSSAASRACSGEASRGGGGKTSEVVSGSGPGVKRSLGRPGSRAESIAGQIFALGRVQPVAEIVEKLDAIEPDAVRRFAAFTIRTPTIAALGPVGRLESHAKFAGRFMPGTEKMHAAE